MTNEYYFERLANVKMSIDKRVLSKKNISVDGKSILLQWEADERKVIETETFQFIMLSTQEAIVKVLALQTLNGDIFNKIEIWNE